MTLNISSSTALLIIDVQNDFCPGGALAVESGDEVVSIINRMQDSFSIRVMTQDWHPDDHKSFAANHAGAEPFSMVDMPYGPQVLWPTHCVQGSSGAEFHKDLITDRADLIIRKGFRPEIDSYSAFFENDRKTATGLSGYLRDRGTKDVVLTGLATDFCVYYSAIDAVSQGFGATLVTDACRAIDLEGSLAAAMAGMEKAGVNFIESKAI